MSTPGNDAKLRDAYAELMATRASTKSADTIPLERLRDLAEDRVHGDERAKLLDAVLADPEARREFEILRALATNRPRGERRLLWTGATALAAAAVIILISRNQRSGEPNEMRGSRAPVQVVSPAADAPLERASRFVWHRVASTRSYRLQIVSDDGALLYTTRTSDTTAALPDSIRVAKGAAAHWWVVAENADGTELRSDTRAIHGR